jgi:hypothetical protein
VDQIKIQAQRQGSMSLAKQNAFRSSPAHRRAFAFLEHGVWALFHASRSFLRGRRGPYYERRL